MQSSGIQLRQFHARLQCTWLSEQSPTLGYFAVDEGKNECFMPSLPSVEFNGKCMPKPGTKQAAKHDVGHSQDEPFFIWLQKKSSAALWNSCTTAFGGLLNTGQRPLCVRELRQTKQMQKQLIPIATLYQLSVRQWREPSLETLLTKWVGWLVG